MDATAQFFGIAERFAALSDAFSYPETDTGSLNDRAGNAERIPLVDLQTEYTRLFINAMPEVPCPPYASVYLDGSIMGPSSTAIARLYEECGIASAINPPDHIAAEFECAAMLFAQSPDSLIAQQQKTLISHLTEWTPRFFEKVREHDQCGCYRDAAITAERVIAEAASSTLSGNPGSAL